MTFKLSAGTNFNLSPGSSKTLPIAIINHEDTEVTFTIEVEYVENTHVQNTDGKNWLILDRYYGTAKAHEIQTLFVTANTTSMELENYEAVLHFFTKDGQEKLDDLSIELHVSCFPYGDNGPHSAVVHKMQKELAPVSPKTVAPASGTLNAFSLQVSNPQENDTVMWTMSTGGVDWVSVNPSEGELKGGEQIEINVTTDKSNLQVGTYKTDLILTITLKQNPENREPSSVLYPVKLTIPSKIVPAVSTAQRSAPKGKLTYHGGHLLTAVEVYTIFWGSDWEKEHSDLIKGVNDFFDYIVTSPLIDLLYEYSVPDQVIGKGRRTDTVTITSSEPGQMVGGSREIDDSEIQKALQGWIADGTIPQPNNNTLYFVYLAPGVTAVLNGDRSCNDFCGYHEVIDKSIFYAVVPFINCDDCKNDGQIIDALTKISSHELCEAITDPALDGWHEDSCATYEIGDICNDDVQKLNGYTIQSEWSNKANACRIEP